MIPHEATEHATGAKLVFNSSQKNRNKKPSQKRKETVLQISQGYAKKKKKAQLHVKCMGTCSSYGTLTQLRFHSERRQKANKK